MRIAIVAVSALFAVLTMTQARSDAPVADPLTHLPLPNAASTINMGGSPMPLTDVPVCKSNSTMNFYTPTGKMDAAVAWYSANLKGFKHTHGTGSGRTQDTFYNATGTLIVSITSKAAATGQSADIYSIIYGAIKPGVSEKVIIGMNVQKVDCT